MVVQVRRLVSLGCILGVKSGLICFEQDKMDGKENRYLPIRRWVLVRSHLDRECTRIRLFGGSIDWLGRKEGRGKTCR